MTRRQSGGSKTKPNRKPRIQTKLKVGFDAASITSNNKPSPAVNESATKASLAQGSQIVDDDDSDLSDDFVKPSQQRKEKKKSNGVNKAGQVSNAGDLKGTNIRDWDITGVDEEMKKILEPFHDTESQHLEPVEEEDMDEMQPIYQKSNRLPTFSALVRVNIRSKAEALKWLEHYQAASYSDWRAYKIFKENSQQLIYKRQLRCHHDTRASNPSSKTKVPHEKHTDCKSKLIITVKNFDMKRSADSHLKSYPCEIRIRHWHNHRLQAAESLKHRRPLQQVQQLFHEMFRKGHSPSSALNSHKFDLKMTHGEDFYQVEADGAQCPSIKWCYYQYYKIFKKEYGENYGLGMVEKLQEFVNDYNSSCGTTCSKMYHSENNLLVVICSPIMRRIHENLRSSGEIVFMDFSGGMDRYDTRVGCLASPSVAGGLPLGIILSTSETESMITLGLEMLAEVYPEKAFYSRGRQGPQIFMTDDSSSERNSLKNVYPSVILLLCIFHVLQAFLRYVTHSNHQVEKKDRGHVVDLMKKVVYASTQGEFKKQCEEMLSDNAVKSNKVLVKHLVEDIYSRAAEWAVCYRQELRTRGNNTNNYIESMFRQFKDSVLQRVKAFNIVQLFDFLTTRLDAYLESRIASVLNGRNPNISRKYRPVAGDKLEDLEVSKVTNSVYRVKNKNSKGDYIVDMELDLCSCYMGKNGGQCKHQYLVAKNFNLPTQQFFEFLDESQKMELHKIMTGNTNVPDGWYSKLRDVEIHSESVSKGQCQDIDTAFDEIGSNQENGDVSETLNEANRKAAQDAKRDECKLELKQVFHRLNSALDNNPDQCLAAIQSFAAVVNAQKTDAALSSTLFLFKQLLRRKRDISVNVEALKRRNKLVAKRKLGGMKVSTEALKRRTTHLGGRKCQQTGRLPKVAFVVEHGYSQQKGRSGPMDPTPSKVKAKAPHSFAEKVNALKFQEPPVKRGKRK